MELSRELAEICKLLHERNELQRVRQTARRRCNQLNLAHSYKTNRAKWLKDMKETDVLRNTDLVKLEKMLEIAGMGRTQEMAPIVRSMMNTRKALLEQCNSKRAAVVANEPRRPRSVSNKLLKLTPRQMMIRCKEARVAETNAELALHYFSDKYSKTLRALLKKTNMRVWSNASNMSTLVDDTIHKWYGRKEIASIAATQILEDAMVNAC